MDNITARKKAYDLVIKAGGKGTFDQFNASLDNPDNRRKAYEIVTKAGGRGSFPAFEKALGYGGATPPTPPASPAPSRIPDIPEGAAVHVGSPLPPGTVIVDPETGKPSDTIKSEPTPAQPINYVEQNPLRRMDDTALNRRIAELSDKNRETEDYNRRVESENRRRRYSGPGGYYGLASMLSSANRGTLDRRKPVMLEKRENPYAAPLHDLQGERLRRDKEAAQSRLGEMQAETDRIEQQGGEDKYTRTARHLQRETEKLLQAPTVFDSDRSTAWWDGLSSQIANADTWSGGITEIARSLRLGEVADRLNKGEELSPSELLALESYADYTDAASRIEPHYAPGYRIGQQTAASIPFTVEMALTAGLGAAAKKALVSSLVRAGKHEAAEKLAKALGGVTIKSVVRDPASGGILRDAAGKAVRQAASIGTTRTVGGRIGKEAAETVLQTAAMPTTWSAVSTDRLDKLLSGEDYDFLDFARSFTNSLVETHTERFGGKIADSALRFIPTQRIWGGLHGVRNLLGDYIHSPLGETFEEYYGAVIDAMRSYNPLYSDEDNEVLRPGTRLGDMEIASAAPGGIVLRGADGAELPDTFASPADLLPLLRQTGVTPAAVVRPQDTPSPHQPSTDPLPRASAASPELPPTGRSLTQDEAASVISAMEARAVPAPELDLTPENWTAQFGEDGIVPTPIGNVKMGENQYFKLAQQGRSGKLGMIRPTLTDPDIIIEEESHEENAERPTSYIYIKTFKKADGNRYYHFTSVTVSKDGREVVISNQEKSIKRISSLLRQGRVVWINNESGLHPIAQMGESDSLGETNRPTDSDSQPAWLGISSPGSQEHTTVRVPDSKDTKNNGTPQYPTDKKGEPDFVKMDYGTASSLISRLGDTVASRFISNNIEAARKALTKARRRLETATGFNALLAAQAETEAAETRLSWWEGFRRHTDTQKEAEAAARLSSQQEAEDYAAQSLDPIHIAAEYRREKETATPEAALSPWQRDLLGTKITTRSFDRFADRNLRTQSLARAWLSDTGGRAADAVAQELSTIHGVEVTPQMVVDFIVDNPTGSVPKTTQRMRDLDARFKELAARDGYKTGGIESETGRMYLRMRQLQREADALRNSAESEAQPLENTAENATFAEENDNGDGTQVSDGGAPRQQREGDGVSQPSAQSGRAGGDSQSEQNARGLREAIEEKSRDEAHRVDGNTEPDTQTSTSGISSESSTDTPQDTPAPSAEDTDTDDNWLDRAWEDRTPLPFRIGNPARQALAERRATAERALKGMNIGSAEVTYIETPGSIADREAKAAIEAGAPVSGWYSPASDTVYIYLPNVTTANETRKTLLHELVAHKGLRGLLGREAFDSLCDSVWDTMDDTSRRQYAAYILSG